MAGARDLASLLPHQAPMRFLDEAEMQDDGRLIARQAIPSAGAVLEAHFPGAPLWPGALLIEAMAQTTAVWLLHARGGLKPDEVPLLGAVDCTFRKPVRPGTTVIFETRCLRQREGLGLFAVTAAAPGGDLLARARITAGIRHRTLVDRGEP